MNSQNIDVWVKQFADSSDDERRQLLAAIQEKEEQQKILNEFALSLMGISHYDDLVWYVAKEVVGPLGFVDCVIYEYLPERNSLIQRAAMGDKSPQGRLILNPLTIPLGKGVTGRSAQQREAIVIDDLSGVQDYVEDLTPARSELCVPLVIDDELLGVIDCENPNPGHFTPSHVEVLSMVAAMTSSKIRECRGIEKLRTQAEIIEQVQEAVALSDKDGNILDCNSALLSMFEYSKDELVGRHISTLVEDKTQWEKVFHERTGALDRSGKWRGYERVRSGTGKILTIDLSLTPLLDEYGNWVATIAVGRDMTALLAAEAALRDKNAAIERKQLALEQALKASEQAKSESQAKDAFLANTSHELRTPLAGLVGMIDLLGDTDLDAEQAEFVSTARTSAKTLSGIVNDILDLAKMEAGKIDLKESNFDPVELVRLACMAMAPSAVKKNLVFDEVLPDGPVDRVLGDPNRIRQILFNLIGNAIKFTECGSISVELSVIPEEGSSRLELSVTDTGIGLSESAHHRIFKRFHQLDQSSKKGFEGAGLGLAISRELAGLMGGAIHVRSKLGEGSCFTLELTLPRFDPPESQMSQEVSDNVQYPELSQVPRILIVEDNPILQKLVTKYADKAGWYYKLVSNGKAAVEAVEVDADFDLILMDIRMPVMDGEEATTVIRSMPGNVASIPIVALTANAGDSDRQRYLALGMNDVLSKPIDGDLLRATVARLTGTDEVS